MRYTAVLDVREGAVFFLARLLWLRRRVPMGGKAEFGG